MQTATTTKRHVGELARIVPALDRHHTDRARHAGIGHRQNRLSRSQRRQTQRLGHMLGNGLFGQARIELLQQTAAQRPVGRNAAQQHIGIGHGGAGVAAPVTSRAGNAAGRLGADLQHAACIDRSDRTATGADGLDLDHGRAHHQAKLDRGLCGQRRLARRHQGHIKGGAPNVAGDDVLKTRSACNLGAGHHARRRTRQRGAHRHITSGLARHDAAIALHDQEFTAKALGTQVAIEALQIAAHHRLQSRVQGGRGAALELANLGQHFTRRRHIAVGPNFAHCRHSGLFVAGVGIGVHKEHAHRLTAFGQQGTGLFAHLIQIHGRVQLAIGQHALVHFQTPGPRHHRGVAAAQAPGLWAVAAAHLQHVPEPACGDDAGAGDLALQQSVGAHCRAVHDGGDLFGAIGTGVAGHFGDAVHEAPSFFAPGRRHLDDAGLAGFFVQHKQVGEGTAHVHAHHPMRLVQCWLAHACSLVYPSALSLARSCAERSAGDPQPPPPGVCRRTRSPFLR